MEWIISHQSAVEYWRSAHARKALAGQKLRLRKLPDKPADAAGLTTQYLGGISLPAHVLVGSDNARKSTRKLCCHICSGTFPLGSFIRIDEGSVVSSPELCFVQMASALTLVELVQFGFELCGKYRLDAGHDSNRGFRDDDPLTSVAQLERYISKASGMRGRKNAQTALRYMADNSASPMETILTMLLTLPYRLGGFGFSMPLLNCPVRIRGDANKAPGRASYYCDLYWPEEQVDVEYDSDSYHLTSGQITKDSKRRNALFKAGATVVSVTKGQIQNRAELRKVAKLLSDYLEKRLVYPLPEFETRHAMLHRQLLFMKHRG
ncbi:MAG: hypothetical protein FWC54_05080 [Actinomycetia bacterium]|nr:hypothetical protein [Actinomycetes bacterium]